MIARLFCLLGQHATYRERRDLDGCPAVMHLVCEHCGSSWPVLDRALREHQQIADSQIPPAKARKVLRVVPTASERARALESMRVRRMK